MHQIRMRCGQSQTQIMKTTCIGTTAATRALMKANAPGGGTCHTEMEDIYRFGCALGLATT